MSQPILLGNSGSPRWYEGGPERLDAYLARLRAWGASSTEMVLHHGLADERTARVHVLREDWPAMIERYVARGIVVQFHVSLDPRFATGRWLDDRDGLRAEYDPFLQLLRELSAEQPSTVLVLHGASSPQRSTEENRDATVGLLSWLAERLASMPAGARAALELVSWRAARPTAAGSSRESVLGIVEAVGSPRVGICWDLAHDFENRDREAGWVAAPSEAFLRRVAHVHVHDVSADGVSHFPPVLGAVPIRAQLAALARARELPSLTMEIRWRCAASLGDPWDLLGQSYAGMQALIDEIRSAPAVRPRPV